MSTQSTGAPGRALAQPLDASIIGLVVFLCLLWGFNQVAVKLSLPDIPPLTQALIRSLVGGAMAAGIARARGVKISFRGTMVGGTLAGLFFALEFILIYRGLLWTTASRAVLFIYSAPIVVILGARWLIPGDRFSALQWWGVALAFAGLVIAFGVPTPASDPHQMLGDAMMILAAISWAATTLVIKASRLNQAPAEVTFLYQLMVSIPFFAVGAWLFGEQISPHPSALAVGSLAYQAIVVVGFSYLVWFTLILRHSASRLSAFTFITPLAGVLAGHLVLGDPVTLPFGLAVLCVIGGLALVNRR